MKKIGKYEIIEELGRGGMGVVYKAYDTLMEREVALKVILEIALQVPEIKSRFYREARTAGKLTHENITIIHDVGEDEGRPYIVMEYLPGRDLRSIIDKHEPLTIQQKLDFAIQISRGLAYSHSKDIIHRDVKPANIRIVDEKKVKIMDFGIAKPGSSNLTTTGAVIGTPFYMSPEQIQGKKIDKRSDIFSFGVLFYELLTYHKPFSGNEPTAVMYKIVHEPPEHLEELERDFPPRLKAIVTRTLQKDPDQRYQDLNELADDLETIIHSFRFVDKKKLDEQRRKIEKLVNDVRSLLSKHKLKDAQEVAAKAAEIDPHNSQVARIFEQIRKAEEEERKRGLILDKILTARKLYTARNYAGALEAAEGILSMDPKQPDALQIVKTCKQALAQPPPSQAKTVLRDEVTPEEKTVLVPQPEPAVKEKPRREKRKMGPYLIAAAVTILVAAGLVYIFLLSTPAVPTGYVALNVLPWAEISKIENQHTRETVLQEWAVTPCRLTLPEGTYEIHFTNPAYQKPLVVTVTIKRNEVQEVRKKMPGFDHGDILSMF